MTARLPLTIILINVFLDLFSFGMIIPLLPFYAQEQGASALIIGALLTIFSAAQFIFSPIWGHLSDVVGRRPIILGSLIGSGLSMLLLANAYSILLIFAARTLAGVTSANVPTTEAYIADTTEPGQRAKGMAWLGAAQGLGLVFGPAAGGFLLTWGYATPFYLAAGLYFVDSLMALFLLPESLHIGRGRPEPEERISVGEMLSLLRDAQLAVMLVISFLIGLGFALIYGILAIFFEARFGFTGKVSGYMFTFVGVVAVLTQVFLVGPLVRWMGERRLMTVGLIMETVGLPALGLPRTIPGLLAALGVLSVAVSVINPAITSLVSRATPARYQGGILGVMQSLASLSRIVGPVLGGFIFDREGPVYPFLWAGVVLAVALLGGVWLIGACGAACQDRPLPEQGQKASGR